MTSELEILRKRVQELEKALVEANVTKRFKIDVWDDKVLDSNPYSRLLALKRLGVVQNYEDIRKFTVAIVGIGGVGSVAAEMLTRCGIGKLILFDYDKVELANMNRLFFLPEHTGMYKTEAAAKVLYNINPDVQCETYSENITLKKSNGDFKKLLASGSLQGGPVDLVLGCVDNFGARIAANMACLELNITWMESGVSEDAMGGHVQLIVPGRTACYECVPPLIVASGIPESTLKREGVCAASLPTTMGLVSALLALTNYFPSHKLLPNKECTNLLCIKRQQEHTADPQSAVDPLDFLSATLQDPPQVVHEDNEYGIVLESSSLDPAPSSNTSLPTGLQFQFEKSDEVPESPSTVVSSFNPTKGAALAHMRQMLRDAQNK